MSDVARESRILRFGAFELDLRSGELRKGGIKIKLQDRPFQILSVLLEQPGEVVTREELQKRLWPADTFVDFEHGLNTAITKLRQALADEADNPRFIETLPRRGYRFVAPVMLAGNGDSTTQSRLAAEPQGTPAPGESAPAVPAPIQSDQRTHTKPRVHFVFWLAALAVASAVIGFFLLEHFRATSRPRWSEVKIVPLNGLPRESYAAFSPDGSHVAFAWGGPLNGRMHIYVSQIGAGSPMLVTNSSSDVEIAPVWSPDGQYIAFVRYSDQVQRRGIYIISALGGSERKVYSTPYPNTESIDWSPDGKYLSFAERKSPSDPSCVFLLALDDLHTRQITFPPAAILGDWDPVFSPDGKSLAFLRDNLDTQEIYIMPAEGGPLRQLTNDRRIILGISWNASGDEIIFSSNRGGPYSLWRIPAAGGAAERLPIGGGGWAQRPTVARHGNRLAYTNVQYSSAIWRVHLPAEGAPAKEPGRKFITSTELEEGPQFSPDAKRIVFQSTRTGTYEIWRCDSDGSNALQLTHFGGALTGTPRWSPDSRQISFDSRPEGHSQVYVINAEGGEPRQLTTGTAEHGVSSWSTDGNWIYYAATESGTWEVWKISPQGDAPVQITRHGGWAPLASHDGKFIYYVKGRDLEGIWKVPVDGGEETKVVDGPPSGGWGYYGVADNGLYYGNAPKHANPGIYYYDFKTGASRKVLPLDNTQPSNGAPGMAVSPDGRSLLYVLVEHPPVYIILVENFR
jgi:Tol biopolymer transport system component/DNA-binding winged helix-turn-helix (wHTH) protein